MTGIVNGERAITAETALRLARFFGTTPEFRLNLQAHYDLTVAAGGDAARIERAVERLAAEGLPTIIRFRDAGAWRFKPHHPDRPIK